jgi:transposase
MADMDTSCRRRKKWPEALMREIVSATLQPGASVSVVARQYDVNANQVFSWRRRYCIAPTPPPAPALVPVTISPAPDVERNASSPEPAPTEAIEIEVGGD